MGSVINIMFAWDVSAEWAGSAVIPTQYPSTPVLFVPIWSIKDLPDRKVLASEKRSGPSLKVEIFWQVALFTWTYLRIRPRASITKSAISMWASKLERSHSLLSEIKIYRPRNCISQILARPRSMIVLGKGAKKISVFAVKPLEYEDEYRALEQNLNLTM